MATLKRRLHRNNGSGYDTVHFETESSLVLRPSGRTVEQDLADYLPEVQASDSVPESLKSKRLVIGNTKGFINGKALSYEGHSHSEYAGVSNDSVPFRYITTAMLVNKYYKINILSTASWMYAFTIRIYQSYTYYDIVISGYNYGASHWYSPAATLIGSTADSIQVHFGYDSDYNLWVAIPAGNYTGLAILNSANGYRAVDPTFSITLIDSLPSTVQTSVTAYRPANINELNSLKTSVSNGKSAVASAITDKGISTSATASFDTMANNIRSIDSPVSSKSWITTCKVVANRSGESKIYAYKSGWSFTLPVSFKVALVIYHYTTSKSTDAEALAEITPLNYYKKAETLFDFLENFNPDSDPYFGIDAEGYWVCIKKIGSGYRTIQAPNVDRKSNSKYIFNTYNLNTTDTFLKYSISGSNVTFTFTADDSTSWSGGGNYYALPIIYCL